MQALPFRFADALQQLHSEKGLLYHMPSADDQHFISAVEFLKKSLSEALVHFYPLAGRLITSSDGVLYIDCNDAGADLIEALAPDVGIQEIIEAEVGPVVRQLFTLDGAINLDGHSLPLLVVQVTKLRDGVAMGFTVNNAVVDGTSLWHFINSWADLCRGAATVSHPPLHSRCFNIKDSRIAFNLPETQTIGNFSPPALSEKIFHFSKETISRLKDRANRMNSEGPNIISSFQALCAHIWQAITRARGLLPHEPTTFKLGVNCRPRLIPPLPYSYFGNAAQLVSTTVTAGEILSCDISSTALLLHRIIWAHNDAKIRDELERYNQHPTVMKLDKTVHDNSVLVGSSPRFPMYDNDFRWGRPVCVRSGWANKFDGKISAYPAREGGESVDLEICLLPPFMAALESDPQILFPTCDQKKIRKHSSYDGIGIKEACIGIKEACRSLEWTPGPVRTISPFFFHKCSCTTSTIQSVNNSIFMEGVYTALSNVSVKCIFSGWDSGGMIIIFSTQVQINLILMTNIFWEQTLFIMIVSLLLLAMKFQLK